MEKEKEFLKKLNCKGCFNHCCLASPMCNRSQIYIKEAIEKYKKQKE